MVHCRSARAVVEGWMQSKSKRVWYWHLISIPRTCSPYQYRLKFDQGLLAVANCTANQPSELSSETFETGTSVDISIRAFRYMSRKREKTPCFSARKVKDSFLKQVTFTAQLVWDVKPFKLLGNPPQPSRWRATTEWPRKKEQDLQSRRLVIISGYDGWFGDKKANWESEG